MNYRRCAWCSRTLPALPGFTYLTTSHTCLFDEPTRILNNGVEVAQCWTSAAWRECVWNNDSMWDLGDTITEEELREPITPATHCSLCDDCDRPYYYCRSS